MHVFLSFKLCIEFNTTCVFILPTNTSRHFSTEVDKYIILMKFLAIEVYIPFFQLRYDGTKINCSKTRFHFAEGDRNMQASLFLSLLVSIHDAPTNIRVMPAESSVNYAGLDSLHELEECMCCVFA